MLRLRTIPILILPMLAGACAAPMTGARTIGTTASTGAFRCATQAAANFGYTSVNESDGIAVLTKPKAVSLGREVTARLVSLGGSGARSDREDRFIVSNADRFLRIDVVAVEASGSDAPPSAKSLNDAAAILARCSNT